MYVYNKIIICRNVMEPDLQPQMNLLKDQSFFSLHCIMLYTDTI